MPEDSYHGEDIVNHAKNFAAIHGDKFVNATEEERRKALVDYALPLNIQGLKDDLAKYRIHYDRWFLESSLHENGEVQRIIELFKQNGATYELSLIHISEPTRQAEISYAVFCLKKKKEKKKKK